MFVSRKTQLVLVAILGVILVLSFPLTNVVYAEEAIYTEEPDLDENMGYFAPYNRDETYRSEANIDDLVLAATNGLCRFTMEGDYPHLSNHRREVSTHGWWEIESDNQNCPEYAYVEVWLQANWCDFITGCRWITLAHQEKRIREGGGSGRRTTARYDCASNELLVGYRNVVDVDLVGVPDLPNKLKITREVECYPDYP